MRSAPSTSTYLALTGMTFAFGLSFVATKYGAARLRAAAARAAALHAGRRHPLGASGGCARRASRSRAPSSAGSRCSGFVSLTVYFSFENIGDRAHQRQRGRDPHRRRSRSSSSSSNVFTLREHNSGAAVGRHRCSRSRGIVALVLARPAARGGGYAHRQPAGARRLPLGRRLQHPGAAPARSRSALFVTTFQNLFGALFMAAAGARGGARRGGPPAHRGRRLGGVLFLTLVCSSLAYLLLNYAFRFLRRAG